MLEIYQSWGLDVPQGLALHFGGAADDTFRAPDEDGDGCPIDLPDTEMPAVPLSSDDEPLLAAYAS